MSEVEDGEMEEGDHLESLGLLWKKLALFPQKKVTDF